MELWNDGKQEVIKTIFAVFIWFKPGTDTKEYLIPACVLFVLDLLLTIWFLFIVFMNNIKHKLFKWAITPTRFMLQFVEPMLLIPTVTFFGQMIQRIIKVTDTYTVLFFVFSIISLIDGLVKIIFTIQIFPRSTRLLITWFSSFEPSFMNMIYATYSIFAFIAPLLSTLSWWVTLVEQVIFMFMLAFAFIWSLSMPLHTLQANVVAGGVIIGNLAETLLSLILSFVDSSLAIKITSCVLSLVFPIIGIVVVYFIDRAKREKVKYLLSYKAMSNEDGESMPKEDYIKTLGLEENPKRILMFLNIGLDSISDLFIDWTLLQYCAQATADENTIVTCIQIISFFPYEQRILSTIQRFLPNKANASFYNRYMFYELFRLKSVRQSSTAFLTSEAFSLAKASSVETLSKLRSFWKAQKCSVFTLDEMNSELKETVSMWSQVLGEYPNSTKVHDEYCDFLIDGPCEFEEAITEKFKSELIEGGKSFAPDYTFRSFVNAYPQYLKQNVLTIKGKAVTKAQTSGSQKSASSSGQSFSTNSSLTAIDPDTQDNIGKSMILQSKLRLPLSRALHYRRSTCISCNMWMAWISFLIIFITFLVVYLIFKNLFFGRESSMERIDLFGKARFANSIAYLTLLIDNAWKSGNFLRFAEVKGLADEDPSDQRYIEFTDRLTNNIIKFNTQAIDYFADVLSTVAEFAQETSEVYTAAGYIFDNHAYLTSCTSQGNFGRQTLTDASTILTYTFTLNSRLAAETNNKDMLKETKHCEMYYNFDQIRRLIPTIITNLINYQQSDVKALQSTIDLTMKILPPCVAGVIIILTGATFIGSIIDIKKTSSTLLSIDEFYKKEMRKSMNRNSQKEAQDDVKYDFASYSIIFITLFIFICIICVVICLIFMLINIRDTNDTFLNLNKWQSYSTYRSMISTDSLIFTILTVLAYEDGGVQTSFLKSEDLRIVAQTALTNLDKYNTYLLEGEDGGEASTGYDTYFDSINLNPACELEVNNTLHNLYYCGSLSQNLGVYIAMLRRVLETYKDRKGTLDDDYIINAIHNGNAHLWARLLESTNYLYQLAVSNNGNMNSHMITMMIVAYVLAIIMVFAMMWSNSKLAGAFHILMIQMIHIPPHLIISNKDVLDILLKRTKRKTRENLSTSENIIKNSMDAIILTSASTVIEMVNPSVSSTLGYTPDQLLGQGLASIFTKESAEEVMQKAELMTHGQISTNYEAKVECLADDGHQVHCKMTMMGMKGNTGVIRAFVFIITDESELLEQQKTAEEAKAKSEQLLYQILPRDVVVKLNAGEKDISFTVPHATIIFIDIVKFSEYSALLTPEDIMANLSLVFATFDRLAATYPLITKIKLIGDVYMAAGGLFGENKPEQHAEQVVKFGLDAVNALDDVNGKLNSNLSVRVGVNTGGPILAGVLGTDKPVFDIIGDPINVASRLQSTDVPGRVQISQETYEILKETVNMHFENRGEVFLKGKGKQTTYFVNVDPAGSFDLIENLSSQHFQVGTPSMPLQAQPQNNGA